MKIHFLEYSKLYFIQMFLNFNIVSYYHFHLLRKTIKVTFFDIIIFFFHTFIFIIMILCYNLKIFNLIDVIMSNESN